MALSIVLERGWPQGQWAWESADPAPVLGNSLSLQIHKKFGWSQKLASWRVLILAVQVRGSQAQP